MTHRSKPLLPANQQALLDGVSLRPIRPDERQRFDQLLIQVHHSHNASRVGGQLRCVAGFKGQWVALLAWSAAAFNLKDREAWIGWRRRQKRRRLPLAGLQVADLRPDRSDLAGDIAAADVRHLDREAEALPHPNVQMVERTGSHAHERLARVDRGHRHVGGLELLRATMLAEKHGSYTWK